MDILVNRARARVVRLTALAAGVAVVVIGSTSARADTLYATGFDAPTYTNGGLIGQDGWVITGTSVVNPISVSNTITNGTVALATTGQDVNHLLSAAVSSGSVFLSADITISTANTTGDYFLHLSDGGTSSFFSRIYARSSGTGFVMAMGTSSGTTTLVYGAAELAFGTTYHILARLDMVPGLANDTGALFVNPVDPFGVGDTAYVAATTIGVDPTVALTAVNLRQGTATSAPALVIDNITVATIPGPASLSLLGVGGLVAARRRRA